PPPELTPYQASLLRHALQALDAALAGASLRDTAEAVFGPKRVAADWFRSSPLRDQVRYLVRRGRRLMAGGYRDLLASRLGRGQR
ncbi:DNA -binding domain-containing protein, partial [Azospirillum isscasi]